MELVAGRFCSSKTVKEACSPNGFGPSVLPLSYHVWVAPLNFSQTLRLGMTYKRYNALEINSLGNVRCTKCCC